MPGNANPPFPPNLPVDPFNPPGQAPPLAVDDLDLSVDEDSLVELDENGFMIFFTFEDFTILDNDRDPNGDPLTITEFNGGLVSFGVPIEVESEGGRTAFLILDDGNISANGAISLWGADFNSLGDGETDTIEFTYTISDGTNSDTATVRVTVQGQDEFFYLNDKNATGPDGTTFLATDGSDKFVYDFNEADTTVDSFEIHNFDSSQDILIFTNAEAPGEQTQNEEREDPFIYLDSEGSLDDQILYLIQGRYFVKVLVNLEQTEDQISIYSDEGATLSDQPVGLNYDEPTVPTPDTAAYVYEGDPFAVEGIG